MKEIVLTGAAAERAMEVVKRVRELFPLLNDVEDGEILRALVNRAIKT